MFDVVLNNIGRLAVQRVRDQLVKDDKVVTGETYNSVKYVTTNTGVEVRANGSILTLIKGRKRTENSGDGQVRQRIERWAKIKGIPKNAVGAIVRKIHTQGIQVPNKYTDGKLLIRALDGFEKDIKKELGNGYKLFNKA